LIQQGLVTEERVDAALALQRVSGLPLGRILADAGAISEEDLNQAVSAISGIPIWDLVSNPPSPMVLQTIPLEVCLYHKLLPVYEHNGELTVAMRDVDDVEASDIVAQQTKKKIRPALVNSKQLDDYLATWAKDAGFVVGNLVSKAMEAHGDDIAEQHETVLSLESTAPVVSLVNQIISGAIDANASDIHLEAEADVVTVRYRLDGMLHVVQSFPAKLHAMCVARIKIMAEMDVVENRLPQDGRFTAKHNERPVNIRVSIVPNLHGPRVVMRILDGTAMRLDIDAIGFESNNKATFRTLTQNPYGLILVTGPTGSGKTTTLYAALNALRNPNRNIMTCEDPIEYDLEGVNQAQTFERIGLTFDVMVRAMLRQDPDVVLVGEIRDSETLDAAVRASMTGHLVLSTLHCNDAVGSLPRMFDIGAEPYLLSTSLIGVVAQRLLRKVCPHCREECELEEESDALAFGHYLQSVPRSTFRSRGCPMCMNTGYKGRTAIHEVFCVTPDIGSLIAKRCPSDEIAAVARIQGFKSMQEDALARVMAGVTTIDEVRRVLPLAGAMQTSLLLRKAA